MSSTQTRTRRWREIEDLIRGIADALDLPVKIEMSRTKRSHLRAKVRATQAPKTFKELVFFTSATPSDRRATANFASTVRVELTKLKEQL